MLGNDAEGCESHLIESDCDLMHYIWNGAIFSVLLLNFQQKNSEKWIQLRKKWRHLHIWNPLCVPLHWGCVDWVHNPWKILSNCTQSIKIKKGAILPENALFSFLDKIFLKIWRRGLTKMAPFFSRMHMRL